MKMLMLLNRRRSFLNTSKNTFATELHQCLKVYIWLKESLPQHKIQFSHSRLKNELQSSHTWFVLDSPHFSQVLVIGHLLIPNYETHKPSSGYFCLPNRNLTQRVLKKLQGVSNIIQFCFPILSFEKWGSAGAIFSRKHVLPTRYH